MHAARDMCERGGGPAARMATHRAGHSWLSLLKSQNRPTATIPHTRMHARTCTVKLVAAHLSAMVRRSFSIFASCFASLTISAMGSAKLQ